MRTVASLIGSNAEVREWAEGPKGADAVDYLEAGLSAEKLPDTLTPVRPREDLAQVVADALEDELRSAERDILKFPRTDAGNAEALAHFYGSKLRYDHKRGLWLVFHAHHWAPDHDGERVRFCKRLACLRHAAAQKLRGAERNEASRWARLTESRQRIEATLALARVEFPISDKGEGWNADPLLLGVPNGVVDLLTGTLRDGKPEDRIT